MRFRHVALRTADPDALRPFYAETLGLPVADADDGFVAAVGASALAFRRGAGAPTYHVAVSVPGDVDAAADWLADRTRLLADETGATRIRYDFLAADAVYCRDPAGNVLELLARDGRDGPTDPFGPDALLDVGEVGLVVEDVPGVAATLADALGVEPAPGADEGFCYLGGEAGAFVVVAPGRPWYPTDDAAEPHPVTAVVEAERAAPALPDGHTVVGVDP